MIKKIKSLIEKNRNSDKFIWKLLVSIKDYIWRFWEESKNSTRGYYCHFKNSRLLKGIINNERILIIGSGYSAAELKKIPDNVRIFTCNAGLKLFIDNNIGKRIDLFLCRRDLMKDDYRFEDRYVRGLLLKTSELKIKSNIFVIDDISCVKEDNELKGLYANLIFDFNENNYYLKRLIKPYRIREIKGSSVSHASSGIRLLQYALYFKAKEIYLIGIDLCESEYFWGREKIHRHKDIDEDFIKVVSKKYNNIFSLSKNSPVNRYIKYRPFGKPDV
jgi:hypothetical protein